MSIPSHLPVSTCTSDLAHVDKCRCQLNHMSINSDKSKVMFISSRQNRQLVHSYPEIPYHDSVINSCLSGKLLGVTVNNRLLWSDHIETVIEM